MTPQARRNYVQAMIELRVSERRSCELLGMSRSGYRYRRVVREGDEKLKAQLRAIAGAHPAAGYRTAWALLRREQESPAAVAGGRAYPAPDAGASSPEGGGGTTTSGRTVRSGT